MALFAFGVAQFAVWRCAIKRLIAGNKTSHQLRPPPPFYLSIYLFIYLFLWRKIVFWEEWLVPKKGICILIRNIRILFHSDFGVSYFDTFSLTSFVKHGLEQEHFFQRPPNTRLMLFCHKPVIKRTWKYSSILSHPPRKCYAIYYTCRHELGE